MDVLIVEDHDETRELVRRALEERGMRVTEAGSCAEALAARSGGTFDAIVLDWSLPDGSGLEVCRRWRDDGDRTPVLMLSARGEVADRVHGLEGGADDYLRKPFAIAELVARVKALSRRGPRLEPETLRLGRLEIRPEERSVRLDGEEIPLTRREFAVLELLLTRRGRPVPAGEILSIVWGEETPSARASLDVILSRMRKKLAAGCEEPIRTHRGFGYSLNLES